MKILKNRLVAEQGDPKIDFKQTPNTGSAITPKFLIMHYTAGVSKSSSVSWLTNKIAKASAHLVIGRDGSITQLAAFNVATWHAGVSRWFNIVGLNNCSIGIELDNAGRMRKVGNRWQAASGQTYNDNEVTIARHKHEEDATGWHAYTERQINSAFAVSQLLVSHYNLKDILGHEDIAPFRKNDPGPAFAMESFRARLLGRHDDTGDILKTNKASVNLRSIPTIENNTPIKALPINTKVELVQVQADWAYVFVIANVTGLREKYGWVHMSLLS
jgi:N-acetylmuramoyl-L-alanine amidase